MDCAKYTQFTLHPESELRFEVDKKNTVTLEMRYGLAEIFGREIVLYTKYEFLKGAKIAVFTWHGCCLRLYGKPEHSYISKNTPLIEYLNIHGALEEKKKSADGKTNFGPSVMIVGSHDVGKSTLARILVNYGARIPNRKQIFVDLDFEDNQLAMPGALSALLMDRPLPFEGSYPETALVYHYGHSSLAANPLLYNTMIARIGNIVRRKMKIMQNISGIVINTGGYKRQEGCAHLTQIAKAFKVDLIIVIESEMLKYELLKDDTTKNIETIFLPKSGGAVQRNDDARFELQEARVHQYFYGVSNKVINPHAIALRFSEIQVFRAVDGENGSPTVVPVEPSEALVHHVLALSYHMDPSKILKSNIIGFIVITHVNMASESFTALSPSRAPLPSKLCLLSETIYYDQ